MADETSGAPDRRVALKVLIAAGGTVFTGALVGPAVVFVAAPAKDTAAGGARWVRTVKLESLPEGEPRKVSIVADQKDAWTVTKNVELGAVWLVRKGSAVTAMSAVCPHLGCSVAVDEGAKGFGCPCHTSMFDAKGARVSGPSPRDMDRLETRIEDQFVLVDFHKFRIGVHDRVEVG